MHEEFMHTNRLFFSRWEENDLSLACQLWGNNRVTKYICASGAFSQEEIKSRLALEMKNQQNYGVAYWPIFLRNNGIFIGCCGLRPLDVPAGEWELGIHLMPEFWRQGYALEATKAVIDYAFSRLNASAVCAGHHPDNPASPGLLHSLGFTEIEPHFYAPTGLMHPSYRLSRS